IDCDPPVVRGVVSAAVRHSVCPAAMSEGLVDGGCQVSGLSATNVEAGMSAVPAAVRTLKASTRKPLTLPSVWLKRKLTVFAPARMVPAGRFMVILNVLNPPPMPPYALAFPSSLTLLLLMGIQAEPFTLTLACVCERNPWISIQRAI